MKCWTDYPIEALGDIPGQIAPVRECFLVSFDGNKYVEALVDGAVLAQFKAGYLYSRPGRVEDARCVEASVLRRFCPVLPKGWTCAEFRSDVIDCLRSAEVGSVDLAAKIYRALGYGVVCRREKKGSSDQGAWAYLDHAGEFPIVDFTSSVDAINKFAGDILPRWDVSSGVSGNGRFSARFWLRGYHDILFVVAEARTEALSRTTAFMTVYDRLASHVTPGIYNEMDHRERQDAVLSTQCAAIG